MRKYTHATINLMNFHKFSNAIVRLPAGNPRHKPPKPHCPQTHPGTVAPHPPVGPALDSLEGWTQNGYFLKSG